MSDHPKKGSKKKEPKEPKRKQPGPEVYRKRAERLAERCEQIQLENERLINHIYQIKKYTCRYRKQRTQLMKRLDKWKDGYREADFALFEEATKPEPKPPAKTARAANTPTGGGGRSRKTQKLGPGDPNPPKKPINPYLLFCQENRSNIQEQHTASTGIEMNNQELTKALANRWHDLNSEDKQIYYDMYEREKERYELEMKQFTELQKLNRQQQQQLVQ